MDDIFEIQEIDWEHIDLLFHLLNYSSFNEVQKQAIEARIKIINPDDLTSYDQFIELYFLIKNNTPEPIQAGRNYSMTDIHNLLKRHT